MRMQMQRKREEVLEKRIEPLQCQVRVKSKSKKRKQVYIEIQVNVKAENLPLNHIRRIRAYI